MSFAQVFLDELPLIEGVIRHIAYRHHLSADERDEFASLVKLRCIEHDYAVLRRFEGRSSLRTYLTTVITRLFLDERVKAWGKWRPSAEARRLGPVAIALERLLTRDQLTLAEAIGQLTTGRGDVSDADLHALAARLPTRTPRRVVGEDVLTTVPSDGPSPEETVGRAEGAAARFDAWAVLHEAMLALEPRERLILRLRYEQGCTVAQIAQVLQVAQKPMYRQLDRLLARLRDVLSSRGVSPAMVRELVGTADEPALDIVRTADVRSVSGSDGAEGEIAARGVGR